MLAETTKKIEYYLYNYDYIEAKIDEMKSSICSSEYNQNYYKWIKNRSSSLEDQVIRNINMKRKINKLWKWKRLIDVVLERYKRTDILFYNYIYLKYFCRYNSLAIKEKLDLGVKEQKDIRVEILQYIFFIACKNEILREVR